MNIRATKSVRLTGIKSPAISRASQPRFWRRVAETDRVHYEELALVLSARGIPHHPGRQGRTRIIYVPAMLEEQARAELRAYIVENRPHKVKFAPWPLYRDWQLSPLYVMPLLFFYASQTGALQKRGSLDAIQVIAHGEWERLATALTLHNGIAHLAGNVCFGAFFLALLGRLCGYGHAWLLTCLGGVLGNGLSVLTHKFGYVSIGFSTALFATVGAIAGVLLWRVSERIFMPFAAALAFLAMLGVEGANTDYAAHICGLTAGGALGLLEGFGLRLGWDFLPQPLAACLALAIPLWAWYLAYFC